MTVINATDLIGKFQYALDDKWGYIWGQAGDKWTDAAQKQKVQYMVKNYGSNWINSESAKGNNYYMSARYGSKWVGHRVADCSGLFWWAFKELGGAIAHGSNSIYDRYCSSKGQLIGGKRSDGNELQPGTAIFTGTAKAHGHIGLYIGGGYVIEAKGTQVGVIKTPITDKRWTYWGELKGVEYSGETPVDPGDVYPTLRKGDSGEWVKQLQQKLIDKGYSCGSCGADGKFGNDTQYAVKKFQQANGLDPDGIAGKLTWAALNATKTVLYSVTVPHLTLYQADALIARYSGSWKTEE